MKKLTQYSKAYLVGIKGVGMASLAECLLDAHMKIQGSDVAEDFVTADRLKELKIQIDQGFDHALPPDVDVVIYTGAHLASHNPQVIQAKKRKLPTLCHAQALAQLFNMQSGIAVCGVGGKSSVSAMLAWSLTKLNLEPSYSVGVGKILGLSKIGAYNPKANWFVAEADEYAANPQEVQGGEKIVPRFSYLKPQIIICTNLKFDHPDVYKDFHHTQQIFKDFFFNLKTQGTLIINADDFLLVQLAKEVQNSRPDIQVITFGEQVDADIRLLSYTSSQGSTTSQVLAQGQPLEIKLDLPGKFQILNTLAALTCLLNLRLTLPKAASVLTKFKSTQRRFEFIGQDQGVLLYDDYAHHPHEIKAVFETLAQRYSPERIVVAFQPHTFSRTKALFTEFVDVLSQIPRLVLMDIFPSARESTDPNTTSQKLLEAIRHKSPQHKLGLVKNQDELYAYYRQYLMPRDVFITLGAGNIYQVFEQIQPHRQSQANSSLLETLKTHLPDIEFRANVPLASMTTVHIGGPAEVFCQITSRNELIQIVRLTRRQKIPLTILGSGSNTLIADRGIRGLVVKNMVRGIDVLDELPPQPLKTTDVYRWKTDWVSDDKLQFQTKSWSELKRVKVKIEAGTILGLAINKLLTQSITGLEWFAKIPGSIGGAIVNNIHGGHYFIGQFVESVDIIDQAGKEKTLSCDELEFGYDFSRFHHSQEAIISVNFVLFKGNVDSAKQVLREWSKQKSLQPQNTLGSVFKNLSPKEMESRNLSSPSVGLIIDQILHLKGAQIGEAQVSLKHAGFIENLGQASANDYLKLIKKIIDQAQIQLKLQPKPEIFFLGFTPEELAGIINKD